MESAVVRTLVGRQNPVIVVVWPIRVGRRHVAPDKVYALGPDVRRVMQRGKDAALGPQAVEAILARREHICHVALHAIDKERVDVLADWLAGHGAVAPTALTNLDKWLAPKALIVALRLVHANPHVGPDARVRRRERHDQATRPMNQARINVSQRRAWAVQIHIQP